MNALVNVFVILNFSRQVLTIDHYETTMKPLDAFSSIKTRNHTAKKEQNLTESSYLQFVRLPPIRPAYKMQLTGPWDFLMQPIKHSTF